LSIIKTLEQFDVPNLQPWGAEYFDLFAQASKLCWAERFGEFGDPDSAGFSAADLLSAAKAEVRAKLIREHKVPDIAAPVPGPKHTANVVIVDGEGNMVSMTATQGASFGSRVVIGGLAW
jgi:gamma-glutamyltranspeptidase / glutathione hydrolase